jgi:alkylation response protein AidB-like acyl-CoA dehydrogenase
MTTAEVHGAGAARAGEVTIPDDGRFDDVRAEVRAWLTGNWSADLTLREWWTRLAESGWAFPTWPEGWYGRDLAVEAAAVVSQEIARAGVIAPPHGMAQSMGGPVILAFGTEEQKRRFLPAIATGEEWWCQFFSEPDAGSDLAGLTTRAERDGDEWVVNGQKVWSSDARIADRGLLVARTDIDQPKHKGLSYFIIEVDQPGIELRPIRQMNDEAHFNESFFTNARVADADLIGGVNNGWAVALATLSSERTAYAGGGERSALAAPPGRRAGMLDRTVGDVVAELTGRDLAVDAFSAAPVAEMIELAREFGRAGDPVIRQRLARLYCVAETARLAGLRAQAAVQAGRPPGPESSVGYIAGVTLARMSRDLGLEILGAQGMLDGADAPHGGSVQKMALTSPCHGIMGGTEQIQHNIVGERVLGLPREPQVDRDIPFRELRRSAARR